MEYNGKEYVIKSFHSPPPYQPVCIWLFGPSKAKTLYDHAEMLLKIGVGTPQTGGIYEYTVQGCCSIKVIISASSPPAPYIYDNLFTAAIDYAEEVFRAIGKVTARLHEHGYAHKDYGRANILFPEKLPMA